MGIRCANHVTPLYLQKLAVTSPTGGGRSVGIVRSRTKASEFSLVFSDIVRVGSGQGQVAGACEYGNEPSGSIKCREFLDKLQTG